MSAYRNDHEALLAQCDALRGELANAKAGSEELTNIQTELEAKLAALAGARISEAEKVVASRRLTIRGVVIGLSVSLFAAVGILGYYFTRPAPASPGDTTAEKTTPAAWFAASRAHCNPVEASVYLHNSTPPGGDAGKPYVAACFALAGKLDQARAAIDSLPLPQQGEAANLVFGVVHPIADAGDDMAAGPVMEFVLEYTPSNFMALYHAGMSAYGKGDKARAKRRLREFLLFYSVDNNFTQTAIATLKELESPTQR